MHVFITGATGWVGTAIVQDMIAAGHHVLGLARSDEGASRLTAAGASVHRGSMEDMETLRTGAAEADAVIHTAFNHDFSKFAENAAQDRAAIETLGAVLEGSDRPLLVTGGVALLAPGQIATEAHESPPVSPSFPRASEAAAGALAARGVKVATVRLSPSVHGIGDHGFMAMLAQTAREKGVSAYIGDGANRWPAVHRDDAAQVYRLALETGVTERAYHAVAEEGVAFKQIAEAIGRQLNLPVKSVSPEEAAEHFGWFALFAAMDMPASSARTREVLGWTPAEPRLLADIGREAYWG